MPSFYCAAERGNYLQNEPRLLRFGFGAARSGRQADCIYDLSTPESDTYIRNTSVTGNTLGGCRCLRE